MDAYLLTATADAILRASDIFNTSAGIALTWAAERAHRVPDRILIDNPLRNALLGVERVIL